MNIIQQLRAGVVSRSPEETRGWGRALAPVLPVDTVLALRGDLGAGKTTLVQGLAEAWRVEGPVTSPTFSVYTMHQGDRLLIHLDAYRLGGGADWESLMLEEWLESPWCLVVEWPERMPEWLRQDAWELSLDGMEDEGSRRLRLAIGAGE